MSKIKRFLLCLPLFCVSLFVLLLNSSTGEYYQKADRQDNIKTISGFALNAKVVTAKEAAVQIAAGIPTAEKSEQPAIKPTEQPTEITRPKTGDNSESWLWGGIVVVSLGAMLFLLFKKKKR